MAVTIVVEKDANNRNLSIVWISEDGESGRHDEQLDGAEAPRTRQFLLTRLSRGTYRVEAFVTRNDGTLLHWVGGAIEVGGPE